MCVYMCIYICVYRRVCECVFLRLCVCVVSVLCVSVCLSVCVCVCLCKVQGARTALVTARPVVIFTSLIKVHLLLLFSQLGPK